MADDPQKTTKWVPTPKQAQVLEAAQKAGLNRTITAICKAAHVDRKSFYDWRQGDPGFVAAWDSLWDAIVRQHFNGAVTALAAKAQTGNIGAMRLMAEIRGVLKQRVEHSTKDDQPIGLSLEFGKLTDDQLQALITLDPSLIKAPKQ